MSLQADSASSHRKRAWSDVPALGDIDTPPMKKTKKKKKKRAKEDKEESAVLADAYTNEQKEETLVPMTTKEIETRKVKKKKRKSVVDVSTAAAEQSVATEMSGPREESVAMAKSNHTETNIYVSVETHKKKKKKKKRTMTTEEVKQDDDDDDEEEEGSNDHVCFDLVKELEEFVPDVWKKSPQQIQKLLRYDLHRFRLFKQQGVAVRHGRFTRKENQQVQDNMEDFLALTGIASANQLLYPQHYPEQEADIRKLRVRHCFLAAIAKGIPRVSWQVFIRAKKLDRMNHLGRFSEEEVAQLVMLQSLHGNNWRRISEVMGRSIYSLQKRFQCISTCQGSWTSDEESRLKRAVMAHLVVRAQSPSSSGLTREHLCNNLPWKKISQQVQTRYWNQCRIKWFSILRNKLSKGCNKRLEGLKAKVQLIDTLYNMNIDDAADVDWDKVADSLSTTPVHVQSMFQSLKASRVPNWSRLSYGEIIDFLHEHEMPRLKEKLQKCGVLEAELRVHGTDAAPLLDLFALQDEDLTEVDNTQRCRGQSRKLFED
ncbi:transcription termination factor 1-like [Dunckerocampus dactyliophorus]|uniref:transcription termination factor 1-like n=1 Tax=Dunckerocampus dactyliophorus TaxID=161453 RepID=UPI002405F94C|nr:transcription termination factor 1-like [Dunckerocampus dactyliophorus]